MTDLARRLLFLAALLVLPVRAAGDPVSDCATGEDWWARVAACTAAIESGRWQGARAAWAYSNRAVARAELGQVVQAFDDHNRAVSLDPGDAAAWNNKANSHAEFREWAAALEGYGRAIALRPGYLSAHYNRAGVFMATGDWAAAEQDLTTVLELAPDLVEALAERATARCALGDVEGSLEDRRVLFAEGLLDPATTEAYLAQKGYRGDFDAALLAWTGAGCP